MGHPFGSPSISGISSSNRPALNSPSPPGSIPRRVRPAGRGSSQAANGSAITPINHLTRNTQRHPSAAPPARVITPPRSGPSAVDTPIVAPTAPKAFDRCGPVKDSWMVADIAG